MYPVLFRFGPITLYGYGLLVAAGFLCAITLAGRRAQAMGLSAGKIQNLGLVALVAGLVGARVAYVALHWDVFRADPLEIIRIDHGGLVFYGGLGAGLLGVVWGLRRFKLPGWPTVDLLVPPLVLAHAIGRIGCFLNGCCYGKPTRVPWGVAFPFDGIPRHPTQLYESAALLILFFLLKILERRRLGAGSILLAYGLLYGSWRFLIEFLRADNPVVGAGLTIFQWASLPLAIGCGWALYKRRTPSRFTEE